MTEAPSESGDEALQEALDHAQRGDWTAAAAVLRERLAEDSTDPYVHCWLGVAERELGMEGIAYERFKATLALQPEDPQILVTAGSALAAFDDPDAEPALRTAALMAPDDARARWMYGAFLSREGQPADALRELDAAVALAPDDPEIYYERAVAHAFLGDWASASVALDESVQRDSEDGWIRIVQGLVLWEVGEVESAAESLVEGARNAPRDVEAQLLAALAAAALDWQDAAYEMIERARGVSAELASLGLPPDESLDRFMASVEEIVDDGPEAARTAMGEAAVRSALHVRLMQRP